MMKKQKSASAKWQIRGYSLIEVIVSMGLVSLCIFYIISILPTSVMGVKAAEQVQVATLLGQNILADLRNSPFSQLDSFNGYSSSYIHTGYQNGVMYTQRYVYDIAVANINISMKGVVARITLPPTIVSGKTLNFETIIHE